MTLPNPDQPTTSLGAVTLELNVDVPSALRRAARDLLDAANDIETRKLEVAPDLRTDTEREADDQAATSRAVLPSEIVDERLLYSSLDAAVWASEFTKVAERVKQDEGAMIGWFANCIETAKHLTKQTIARQVRGLGIHAPAEGIAPLEMGTMFRDEIANMIERAQ